MGVVGEAYAPPTTPKNLVLRDCTVNHPLYAIALVYVHNRLILIPTSVIMELPLLHRDSLTLKNISFLNPKAPLLMKKRGFRVYNKLERSIDHITQSHHHDLSGVVMEREGYLRGVSTALSSDQQPVS
jgi:hypothetical protein